MSRPRATIRDVARTAEVSISTVSRALSGHSSISAETVARVKEAASALSYRSDAIGRALRNQSTLSLGLVVPNITNPFFPGLVQAVEMEAKRAGWSMLLADSQDDLEMERENIELLIARRVDAILISPVHRTKSRAAMDEAATSVPIVQFDRRASVTLPHVGVNQQLAMRSVLDHLASTGRRRIVFAGANTGEWTTHERELAFRNWAADTALGAKVVLVDSSTAGGRAAARRILRDTPDVDAIACCNDVIAIGALLELESMGIAVPGTIAVTGYDNTMMAIVSRPALTSVIQPVDLVAREAFALAKAGETGARIQTLYEGELVVRASSSAKS